MTYLELKNLIETMTEDQMNRDVVVKKESEDEYYVPDALLYTEESSCDVFDEDQPYLTTPY